MNITLRQLRSLLAIKSEGRIATAAVKLGLTAPAVTLQLKQLEDELGASLFDRTTHGMRLTAAGEVAIDAAQAVLERLDLLGAELDAIRGARRGSLRVGVMTGARYFAPQLAAAFEGRYPDISVELVIGRQPEITRSLKNYDIELILSSRPPAGLAVRAIPFADYQLDIVAAPSHRLVRTRSIPSAEIARERFIVRERGSGLRMAVERFLSAGSEVPAAPFIEMTSTEYVKRAVTDGLGIALLPAHHIADELEAGLLIVLDVEDFPLRNQWYCIARSNRAPTPLMERFEEFLVAEGARYLYRTDTFYEHS